MMDRLYHFRQIRVVILERQLHSCRFFFLLKFFILLLLLFFLLCCTFRSRKELISLVAVCLSLTELFYSFIDTIDLLRDLVGGSN